MSSFTSVHSRPSVAPLSTSSWNSNRVFVATLWRELFKEFLSSYRPELHYMRGPGPRWRQKRGAVLAHDGAIQTSAGEPWRDARESRGATRDDSKGTMS
jgi:hypothetical protein